MGEQFLTRVLATAAVVLALAASALTLAAPAVARLAPPVPPNIDVSQQLGGHAEDAIAANPQDPQNVVAVSMRGNLTHGLFVGVTFDGGRTWSRRVIGRGAPLGVVCCDEDLAWDRFGNLWLSYLVRPSLSPRSRCRPTAVSRSPESARSPLRHGRCPQASALCTPARRRRGR